MSIPTQTITPLDVDQKQREQARDLTKNLESLAHGRIHITVADDDGTEIGIPAELATLLRHVVRLAAQDQPFSLVQFADTLTSVEAAKLIDVSRPTLVKWAKEGRVPSHKVGSHTRFLRVDVLRLARELQGERLDALDELRTFEESLGLDDK